MIEYRPAAERFSTREAGRTTWHSFSFGSHYDPANVGFAALVAHNDEHLPGGTGYAEHPHADLEIVTWVLTGALRHHSSVGSGVLGPGEVQRLSAGSGVVHAELNDGPEPARFLQAWVRPDEPGTRPDYVRAVAPIGPGWTRVADGDGRGVVPLGRRGAAMDAADLAADDGLDLPDARHLHVFVAHGRVQLGERVLHPGDAARLVEEGGRRLTAEEDAALVVWSFRDDLRG